MVPGDGILPHGSNIRPENHHFKEESGLKDRKEKMELQNSKICLVAHTFYDRDGRVMRYAETLANSCRHVDVICMRDRDQSSFKLKNGVRVFTIPYGYRSKRRGGYLLEYGVSFVLFSIWLLTLFLKHRYQIIHIHNMPDFLIFTGFLPRIFGAKLVLDIHDPMPEVYQCKYPDDQHRIGFQAMRLQEKFSAGFAHAVITANPLFKEIIAKRGIPRGKITVINNVAEERIFNRKNYARASDGQNHSFTLIYIGTVAPRYRLDIPIRALPTIIEQIPEIRLRIIGSIRDGAEDLPELADQLEVTPYVQFVPPIPINEIPQQLIQADIGIYTASPDPHINIANPTKVLEYMAMGIPTVATKLYILENLYSQGGIQFFNAGDPESFAQIIIDLYRDPDKRMDLVRTADTFYSQNKAWKRERSAYLSLLKALLGNDPVA
jgi:glycosyltransferase involved in cell wall biosynthesis